MLDVCLLVLLALGTEHPPDTGPVPETSRQLVLVTTPRWSATDGTLQRFERVPGGAWRAVSADVPVVVGRSGLGWGRGLHDDVPLPSGPVKREGDGRAPAGVFRLTAAFGYAETEPTGLPYVESTASMRCVDDPASASYNLVRRAAAEPDWQSTERMRRRDGLYRIGAIVAHNGAGVSRDLVARADSVGAPAPIPGGGSCIFLHVWRGPGTSTAGCTAMPDPALSEVLAWLDADKDPVLVQLPADAVGALRRPWELPGR